MSDKLFGVTSITARNQRRRKRLFKHPNRLFLTWLLEWYDDAEKRGSNMKYTLRKAMKSLELYPLPLKTGKECKILAHFGDKICQMLDERLAQHHNSEVDHDSDDGVVFSDARTTDLYIENGRNPMSTLPYSSSSALSKDACTVNPEGNSLAHGRIESTLLVILLRSVLQLNGAGFVIRDQLVTETLSACRRFSCSCSVKDVEDTLQNLISEHLVVKEPFTERFKLSEEGFSYAVALNKKPGSKASSAHTTTNGSATASVPVSGRVDILLCVDSMETISGTGVKSSLKQSKVALMNELNKHSVHYDVRKLSAGDFLWICRSRGDLQEYVLPYIVERKRMDDLASSIQDGRYHEQKYRLRLSGLQFPIYLVEEYGAKYASLPNSTNEQAVVNTRIIDEFMVKVTKDQCESAEFLMLITEILSAKYKHLDRVSLQTFADLQKSALKNRQLSIKEMMVKHLMQISGMGVEKAVAIMEAYKTPARLIEACLKAGKDASHISLLTYGSSCRKIGPVTGSLVHKLYTAEVLE